jgi:hypothetical protein
LPDVLEVGLEQTMAVLEVVEYHSPSLRELAPLPQYEYHWQQRSTMWSGTPSKNLEKDTKPILSEFHDVVRSSAYLQENIFSIFT